MKTIITITAYASMPGRLKWKLTKPNGRVTSGDVTPGCAASAAAKAVDLAVSHCRGSGYVILAPQNVLDLIPPELRFK